MSRLVNYSIEGGHSLAAWGERLGYPKTHFNDFSKYSEEMLSYCIQDTLVNRHVFLNFEKYIYSSLWKESLRLEHDVAQICLEIYNNGFYFDIPRAKELHSTILRDLELLTKEMEETFLPKVVGVKEVVPKPTKFGTMSKVGFKGEEDLSIYTIGAPFTRIEYQTFNPGSAKQRVERLNEAGWKPYEKTDGHKDCEAALRRRGLSKTERAALQEKLEKFKVYGWTTSENNLATLPTSAPESARKLVQWLILDRRRSVLEEWLEAVSGPPKPFKDLFTGEQRTDTRIHPTVVSLGAWTHRKSHNHPNSANIPTFHGFDNPDDPSEVEKLKASIDPKLREFWCVPKDRLLVGVDAESIQLRILAHYMDDPNFTFAVTQGNKKDGTDPHSMNRKALSHEICKSRNDAKTYIYAWLLGAGIEKQSQILKCSLDDAREANQNFLDFYPGLKYLKEITIPQDANNGYFKGFDGRFVLCDSEHLMLAGYLQCGETCIMKKAQSIWVPQLKKERIPFWLVNDVHDEWQTETINDMDVALYIAETQAKAITAAGESFNLLCPMAGSYKRDDGTYSIGRNWSETH